jgi:hypothetical protein
MRNCNVMGNIASHLARSSLPFQAPYLGVFVGESRRQITGHHGIRHPGLGHAIADYVQREARAVAEEMRLCEEASPFARGSRHGS